jgi:hypothetical protein
MALLAQQKIDADGLTPAYTSAAGGGDTCAAGEGVYLHAKNGSGGSITVTLVTPGTVGGLAIADRPVAIAAGAEAKILVGDEYANPATGLASITYSGVTSLTVGAFRA